MGLIEQEIKELRQLNNDLIAGRVSPEIVNTRIAIYSQTEKRAKMMLQAFALAAKHNKTHLNRMVRANLIGDGEAIDTTTTNPEIEKVKCPGKDSALIERCECLDYSGSEQFPECEGCEVGIITKHRLLG